MSVIIKNLPPMSGRIIVKSVLTKPVWLTSSALYSAHETENMTATVQAAHGDRPITYSMIAGVLPGGISFNASTGTFSGRLPVTAPTGAQHAVTVRATSKDGFTDREFTINIEGSTVGSVYGFPLGHALHASYLELTAAPQRLLAKDYSELAAVLGTVDVFTANPNNELRFNYAERTEITNPTAGFGYCFSVSDNEDFMVVGNPVAVNGNQRGAALIYQKVSGQWQLHTTLVSPIPFSRASRFGESVSISGDGTTIVVGDPYEYERNSSYGAIHVWKLSSNTWQYHKRFSIPEFRYATPGCQFGAKVLVNRTGDSFAACAPAHYNSGGAVIVYQLVGNAYSEVWEVGSSSQYARFGMSMCYSSNGEWLFLGGSGVYNQDPKYLVVYKKTNNAWSKAQTISKPSTATSFADSITCNSDATVLIVTDKDMHSGTPGISNSGGFYSLVRSPGSSSFGTPVQIKGNVNQNYARLGTSVQMNALGSMIYLSVPGYQLSGKFGALAAFKNTGVNQWQAAYLVEVTAGATGVFGSQLRLVNNTMYDQNNRGTSDSAVHVIYSMQGTTGVTQTFVEIPARPNTTRKHAIKIRKT